jgi:hypothetical protein
MATVDWNAEGALWVQDFKDLFTAQLVECVNGVNSSGLGYELSTEVTDNMSYSPQKNESAQLNYSIAGYETNVISDEATIGRVTEINMTVNLRVIPKQTVKKNDRIEDQDVLVNLVVNYINNKIKSLQTSTTTPYWFDFRTGGIANDLYWAFMGVSGSEIIVTCKANLQGYTT